MCAWEIHREKRPTPQDGLELRITYHLHRERGWGIGSCGRESKRYLGKMNGPLEQYMGGMRFVTKCVWVWSTSSRVSCDKSQSSPAGETPGRGLVTTEFPLEEALSLGR